MTETFSLTATKRQTAKNSARDCRNIRRTPAIIYGNQTKPQTISVDDSELLKLYRKAGKSSLISLDIDGTETKVLIQDFQLHPVQTKITHVDFFAVDLKSKTTVEVPLVFIGESPAVRNFGGIFTKEHENITIRCLPTEIPHDIEVDISTLENINDHLTIADLNLNEKFELMQLSPEVVICSVIGHVEEAEKAPVAEEGAEGEEGEGTGEEGGEKAGGEEKAEEKDKDKNSEKK